MCRSEYNAAGSPNVVHVVHTIIPLSRSTIMVNLPAVQLPPRALSLAQFNLKILQLRSTLLVLLIMLEMWLQHAVRRN
jgi:hypothetical protein